jgi:hypothetical protein
MGWNMSTVMDLLAGMWSHVGPGMIFALALPVLLIAFGIIVLLATKQVRDRARRSGDTDLADETA